MANGNGTDQGSAPANKLKAALGRIITFISSRDWVSSIKNFMGVVVRISVMIVVFLVLTYLAHLFLRRESDRSESPGVAVFNWLERLPTEPAFHYLVAVLAGAYLGWCWYLSANLREEIRIREANEDNSSLTSRDWWVVRGLRGRALAFRTLAGILLGSVVALLFSGIYLAMFVVPQIPVSDRFLAQETNFGRKFGDRLQLIGESRYWFKVADVGRDTPTSEESETENAQWTEMIFPFWAMPLPRPPVLNIHEALKNERTILAIGHDKALVTRDSGQIWSVPKGLELKKDELIIMVAFDADGRFGVIGGTRSSVFVTQDGGETWSIPKGLELEKDERIIAVAFDADGQPGVVVGDKGSIFVGRDEGRAWNKSDNRDLDQGGRIVVSEYGMVPSNKSKILLTQDGGHIWSVPKDLELKEGERIITTTFDSNGQSGVVTGDEGSIFVIQNGGETWSVPKGLELKKDEWIITVTFDADSQPGVVVGDKGSIFVTQDGGKTWRVSENLVLKGDERMIMTAFDADGRFGVVAGDKGSVFVTQDRGKTWSDSDGLKLKESERFVAVVFNTDGKHGVIAGGEGSVFATQNSGGSWISTERDYQDTIFIDVVSALPGGQNFVAVDDNGGIHLLKAYPDMAEWKNRSLDTMRIRIQKDGILRKSVIGREITKFLDNVLDAGVNVDDGEGPKPGDDESLISGLFGELPGMRVVTLIALLFLVQILVRLHQYSLRLAAFLDSRADAVLLTQSFANHSAERFDDLVGALAPDAYDFKPSPK